MKHLSLVVSLDAKLLNLYSRGFPFLKETNNFHTGFGAEVVATIQERCFLSLQAPIKRVCGYDTPFPLVFESHYLPDEYKNLEAILDVVEYSK